MKHFFALCAIVLFSAALHAQSNNLIIRNGTNCNIWVYGYASQAGTCNLNCFTGPVCCPPGTSTSIAPCGFPNFEWSVARIIGADPFCSSPCQGPSIGVTQPGSACTGTFPTIASGTHCICGPFTADFTIMPDVVYIY